MSTATQYNPDLGLNRILIEAGASKTVYALVTSAVERAKIAVREDPGHFGMFEAAWTGKQDRLHEEFFDAWAEWSAPEVKFDRSLFPFYYPCAGASEPIRQLIFDMAVRDEIRTVHIFEGEYEGYRAMAAAANIRVHHHPRSNWKNVAYLARTYNFVGGDTFFISAPSAIDGNVWPDLNRFLAEMPERSVVIDVTYVGAVPEIAEPIDLTAPSVRSIVFSLSKPFGAYYDRIGGVWCREENLGLFGNRWFKNLTSLKLGTTLMQQHGVFDLPRKYRKVQQEACREVGERLGYFLCPSDVYLLATVAGGPQFASGMSDYLRRTHDDDPRVCLTPYMARALGMAGGQ